MAISCEEEPFRLFISTGDVSGDLQAALLVSSLRAHLEAQGRQLSVAGLGGERLARAGAQVFEVPPKLSVVGWWMGLLHVPAGLGLLRRAKLALTGADFDAAVLVDFSGFNVPLARYIRRNYDFPVFYYIPPLDWIWTTNGSGLLHRPYDMQEAVDWVLSVHPREAEYYQQVGCRVELVGHPILEQIARARVGRQQARRELKLAGDEEVLVMLPASRRAELKQLWPTMSRVLEILLGMRPELKVLIPSASAGFDQVLAAAIDNLQPRLAKAIELVPTGNAVGSRGLVAMEAADVALTKTGSVTLELALLGIPMAAVYRLGKFDELIGRWLLRLTPDDFSRITLINHILEDDIVPVFVECGSLPVSPTGLTPEPIAEAVDEFFTEGSARRSRITKGYERLRGVLGDGGAVSRAAQFIVDRVDERSAC